MYCRWWADLGDVETLVAKDYECLDCNKKFLGMGEPLCPSASQGM